MIETILNSLVGFILAIGILVTVHEFGHFWVARKLGVKVLRFSVGFGRPLKTWRRKNDPTEYVLAAIPLGGYVKMLDEREGEVADEELDAAFNRKPLWVRTAVVLAGPLFNLIFAVLLFWLVLVLGETGLRPIVGTVEPESIAQRAGFQVGDEIVRVNAEPTPTWSQVMYQFAAASASGHDLRVEVQTELQRLEQRLLSTEALGDMAEIKDPLKRLGIKPEFPKLPPVVGKVLPGKPGEVAGLQTGDRIVQADGQFIDDWVTWVEFVRQRPEIPIRLEVERNSAMVALTLIPEASEDAGKRIGYIGVGSRSQPEIWARYWVTYSMGLFEAIPAAFAKTWDFSVLTLKVMWRILTGQASLKNLGGPVTMADAAGSAVSAGVVTFLKLLAVISISLGVFNLLPIPVLDGGHLVYFLIEAVMGKPPSEAFMIKGQQLGMALLLSLMALVFYQDIGRLLE